MVEVLTENSPASNKSFPEESFASGYFSFNDSNNPEVDLKSGIPDAVEIPAPHTIAIFFALSTVRARCLRSGREGSSEGVEEGELSDDSNVVVVLGPLLAFALAGVGTLDGRESCGFGRTTVGNAGRAEGVGGGIEPKERIGSAISTTTGDSGASDLRWRDCGTTS